MIKDNVLLLKERIFSICNRLGRNPSDVEIIVAGKYAEADKLKEVIDAGIINIGENRVQDASVKFPAIEAQGLNFTKHMIGHLQTNKVKKAVEIFDLIQSVDSFKLAKEIEKNAVNQGKIIDILVQINTSGEEQKFGVEKEKGIELVHQISFLKNICIQGLMTVAPFVEDKAVVRNCFRDLREIRDQINKEFSSSPNIKMKYLSMGMTDDFEIALEEGSNMIRVGRAIFALTL